MTQATRTRKANVTPLDRFQVRPNAVVYTTRSSDGELVYETTVIDGRATYCTCGHHVEAHAFCKHMNAYQKLERSRTEGRARAYYLEQFQSTSMDPACY